MSLPHAVAWTVHHNAHELQFAPACTQRSAFAWIKGVTALLAGLLREAQPRRRCHSHLPGA